ncbi:AAA family ATPase [Novosphingobium sp. AAP93]|uniref:AAA family ATPase n=1 Tax=Novosphingobium sp. AAP93 TaxID=1523427 RepID=UPI0006B93BA7|nr:AAA family ATPase [Novosphingobium sp. AAP93]
MTKTDPKQLGAVEAGKPFALALAAGTETARMETNLRARSETLKLAQAAAQQGRTGEAMEHLKDHIVEVSENSAVVAAERWLSLPPAERERTGIYVSGRQLRDEVNAAVQTGLAANGEIGPDRMTLTVLSRVNATREELRQVRTYAPGMVLEVTAKQSRQKLAKGRYDVLKVDAGKGIIELRGADGQRQTFQPSRIGAQGDNQVLQLLERKALTVYTGDTIRWTANDHQRGLINADRAAIAAIGNDGLTVRTSSGMDLKLDAADPMLARLDLAYALNAHMAQGLTSDKGIAVMDRRTRKLLSARNFLVTITRLRDELTLIVDNRDKVEMGIGRNPGDKTSALEVTERLGAAAARGQAADKPQEVGKLQEPEKLPELERTITKVVPFEMGI